MKLKKIEMVLIMGLLFLSLGIKVFAEDPTIDSVGEREQLSEKLLSVTRPVAQLSPADKALFEQWESSLDTSMELFMVTKRGKLPAESFILYPEYLSAKDKKTFKSKFKAVDFDKTGGVEIPLTGKKFSGSIERALKAPLMRYHNSLVKEINSDLLDFLIDRGDKLVAVAPVKEEKEKEIDPDKLKAVPLTKKRTVIELLSLAKEIDPKVESERAYVDVLTTFFQLLGEVETEDTAVVYDMLIEEIYFRLIEKSAKNYQTEHNKIVNLLEDGGIKEVSLSKIDLDPIRNMVSKDKSDASYKAAAEKIARIFRDSKTEKLLIIKKLETKVHRSVQTGVTGVKGDGNSNAGKFNSLVWRLTNHYASVEKGVSFFEELSGLLKILNEAENLSSVESFAFEEETGSMGNTGLDKQIVKHEKLLKEYQMRLRKARIERNSEEMEKNLNHIEYEVGLLESLRTRKVEQSIDYLDNNYRIFERQIDKYLSTGTLLPPEITKKYQKSFDKIRSRYEEIFKERNDYSKKRRYKEYLVLEKQMGKISSDIEIVYDRIASEVEKQIEASQGNETTSTSDRGPTAPARRMIPDRSDSTSSGRSNNDDSFPFF